MAILQPAAVFKRITDIELEFFVRRNIKAVMLDVDNTLTTHNNPEPAEGVKEWLKLLKESGIKAFILSNNSQKRVEPFAEKLDLDYVTRACKPLTIGITRVSKEYNLHLKEIALIGDQIFTDVLAGNLKGVVTVLVEPYQPENGWFFKLKRKLEKPVLRKYNKK